MEDIKHNIQHLLAWRRCRLCIILDSGIGLRQRLGGEALGEGGGRPAGWLLCVLCVLRVLGIGLVLESGLHGSAWGARKRCAWMHGGSRLLAGALETEPAWDRIKSMRLLRIGCCNLQNFAIHCDYTASWAVIVR